ncbi:hypothetical protein ACQVUL_01360 [Bacillus cytotoxicus]|uniref:DUF5367 domain-containing protein n=1 Tax=Bacillus cytotoxicus (strain DSM 22905 / CIP 110041 / 391-98 / NVH 391-98) TaxID=315749 RepID=A7GNK8_BACCN|nr:hypothetical protein [Bacillus cytotoxicus]ABS21716.1 conserved hypothetical protein [Bacillus cytotoxicus NVH 391-98]AWC44414.1 hypothetical protein CG479_007675 [Bacillus cytotoxicus]MDH2863079.1 hypothetical protein [Bacillus cytotoxicus]MDH2882992.1 hypothetical protein [Bacillus cytotoxicus]NZD31841.1 hypothetical protein [Bacillus cytotoxicus]
MNGKSWITIIFSIGVWFMASLFFILFGSYVLVEITSSLFLPMLLILEIGTAIALYVVLGFYQKIDSSRYAAIKLGIFGTGIGLFLDSFLLYYASTLFPQLSLQQMISFTIWMVFVYVLYLFIPVWMERKRIKELS